MIIFSKKRNSICEFGVGCSILCFNDKPSPFDNDQWIVDMCYAEPNDMTATILGEYSSEEEAQKDFMFIVEALKNHEEFIEL